MANMIDLGVLLPTGYVPPDVQGILGGQSGYLDCNNGDSPLDTCTPDGSGPHGTCICEGGRPSASCGGNGGGPMTH